METCFLGCKDGQNWALTKPTLFVSKTLLQPPTTSFVTPHRAFCHVEWSPSGSDLAIIDTLGSLYIYGQYTALSPIINLRKPPSEEVTTAIDLNAIVGFSWVAPEKPVIMTNPGMKSGGNDNSKTKLTEAKGFPAGDVSQLLGYSGTSVTYGVNQGLHLGPRMPQGYSSCIGVSRSQVLKLWYQSAQGQPYGLSTVSLNQLYSDDIISHASFAGTKDHKLLLVCYSPAGTIYVYRVEIEWIKDEEPKLKATRLLKETLVPQSGPARLTHLKLFSIRSNQVSSETEAEIVCVFTHPKGAITNRYELQSHTPDLHSTFYSLGTHDAPSTTTHKTHLVSLVETSPSNSILNIGSHVYDTVFFAAHEDGTISCRYRGNVSSSTKGTPFNMFSDAGYRYSLLEGGSGSRPDFICVSPTFASYVYREPNDGGLKLRFIESGIPDGDMTVASLIDSAVVLSLRHSVSCISAVCNDDIMFIMRREIDRISRLVPALKTQYSLLLLAESHKAINFSLDLKKDHQMDKIMINPSLQRLLTMQTVLGSSLGWTRDTTSRLSWCFLNLRLVSFSLTFTLRAIGTHKPGQPPKPVDHAMRVHYLASLSGLKRWCLDFAAYLCQELLTASNEGPDYLKRQHVALPIVMARSSRMLLMYSWRGIKSLDTVLMQKPGTETAEAGLASQRQRELSHFTPISMSFFEQLLNLIDSHTKQISDNTEDRLGLEQQLLFRGVIPPPYMALAKRCVDEFEKFKKTTDLAPLYFYNISWLGLDEYYDGRPAATASVAPFRNVTATGQQVDCLRKFIIERVEGDVLRVCQRCAGVSVFVDSTDGKQFGSTHWTFAFQRNCWCGGMWVPYVAELSP